MAVLNEARLEEIISNCERSGDWGSLKQRYTAFTMPYHLDQIYSINLTYSHLQPLGGFLNPRLLGRLMGSNLLSSHESTSAQCT